MKFFGVLLIIAGLALGLYVGIYLCWFAAIVTFIEQVALVVRGGSVVASDLAWAIVKFFGGGTVGSLCGVCLVAPGVKMLLD